MSDYEYLLSTGVVVPQTSGILTDIQNEFKAVFGQDLVVTPDTPQGVLITALTLARAAVTRNNAAVANQINPNIAGGVFLDAIMALLGVQRTAATKTVVSDVVLAGVAGTIISAGSQAQTAAGDLFETVSTVVIEIGGTVTVDFASVEFGAIPCAEDSLTQIVTSVLGWETVNNPTAGVLGTSTQSDQAARAYRENTLAFQGVALPVAITSALYNVEGVKSLTFLENVAATTEIIETIEMVAHSIWACVDGGTDLDVAAALLENKSSGAAWNGAEEVEVIEPASGQPYTVKFDRPTPVPILVRVTTNGDSASVIQAVLDYAAGLIEITGANGVESNVTGFVVGSDVSPFEIAGAIMAENPGIFINKVEVSYSSPISYTTNVLEIAINELATVASGDISVVTP